MRVRRGLAPRIVRMRVLGGERSHRVQAMPRRRFLQAALAACCGSPLFAAMRQERLEAAAAMLEKAAGDGMIAQAVLHVVQRDTVFTRTFGKASGADAMFLLGSISKPIAMTA